MPFCRRCQTEKDANAFSPKETNHWCRVCRREINRANYDRRVATGYNSRHPSEMSTRLVADTLRAKNIPTVSGNAGDMPYVDLLAWACVPIEAKYSKPQYDGESLKPKFMWSFSPAERRRGFKGLMIFVAQVDDATARYFVIPADHPDLIGPEGFPSRTAVTVTLNAMDDKRAWVEKTIVQYEDRFDLIEKARQEYRA